MTLAEAIDDFDAKLPSDWRLVSLTRDGPSWTAIIRHQLTGATRMGTSFSPDAAAAIAADLAEMS